MKKGVIALLLALIVTTVPVYAKELIKGYATVYSLEGTTKLGTQTRIGMCASGNKELLGKQIVVYQRLPDNSVGNAIGIYTVEDTGCNRNVIDLWYPTCIKDKVIDRTYENNCEGKIYIQIVEVVK